MIDSGEIENASDSPILDYHKCLRLIAALSRDSKIQRYVGSVVGIQDDKIGESDVLSWIKTKLKINSRTELSNNQDAVFRLIVLAAFLKEESEHENLPFNDSEE